MLRRYVGVLGLGVCSGIVFIGCGDDSVSDPPLDKSELLNALTPDQKATLCDWGASLFGGYGASVNCTGGDPVTVFSMSHCVGRVWPAACAATVGDEIACLRVVQHDPCTSTLYAAPECASIRACQ